MQPQYRGYTHQTPSRGSHGNTRKGGIGPMISQGHHPPPLTQAQIQHQAQAQQMATEQAKRRSRKPTDKNMPDGVEDIIIGDGVQKYKDLRDFERRLDATMTRKRLDIIDSINRNPKRMKTLRIWITNTVEDQPWQVSMDGLDYQSNGTPSYRVKIEGRLLGDEVDAENEEASAAADGDKMDEDPKPGGSNSAVGPASQASRPAAAKAQKLRFSTFFKEMTVEFPPNVPKTTETTVHWKKPESPRPGHQAPNNPPPAADFDELTFKRVGDQNMNVVIKLTRHEEPEKFLLSDDLAEIVDLKEATRTEVTMGLWEYIKFMGLQEDDEKRNFRCDELLRKITNRETGYLPNLNEYVQPHLSPLPPITLPYTIRVDKAFHSSANRPAAPTSPPSNPAAPQATIYDVLVPVEDSLRTKMLPFLMNPDYHAMLKEVASMDDQLSAIVQAIQFSKAKHAFLTQMANDPVKFTKSWISSQKRDLEYIMGEASRGGGEDALSDEWRKELPWTTENVRESVTMMLGKGGGAPAGGGGVGAAPGGPPPVAVAGQPQVAAAAPVPGPLR